jgi:hypothetical protein
MARPSSARFPLRKPPGVAVEIAELRQLDPGDLVVRAEALLGDRDGLSASAIASVICPDW